VWVLACMSVKCTAWARKAISGWLHSWKINNVVQAWEHSLTCANLNHTIFEAQAMAEKCEVESWSMGENILRMGFGGRWSMMWAIHDKDIMEGGKEAMGAEIKGCESCDVWHAHANKDLWIQHWPLSNLLKNMTVVSSKMLTQISMSAQVQGYKNDIWFWWDFNSQYFLNTLCLSEQIWANVIYTFQFQHISTYLILRDFHWASTFNSSPTSTFFQQQKP